MNYYKVRHRQTGQEQVVPESTLQQALNSGYSTVGGGSQSAQEAMSQGAPQAPAPVDDGRPKMEAFYDVTTGGAQPLLADKYRVTARPDIAYENVGINTQALEALRNRGLSTEMSPWEKMQREQQALEEQQLIGRTRQTGQRNLADTFSALASRGGLSRSARQRLAAQGANANLLQEQGVRSGGMGARLGIGQAAEGQRLDLLKALPGMELGLSGFNQSEAARKAAQAAENRQYATNVEQRNLDEALRQLRLQDAAKYGKYKEEMGAWAAEKQAKATENSGGGVSWICTEINKVTPFTKEAWTALNQAKEYCAMVYPSAYSFYFGEKGNELTQKMKFLSFNFQSLVPAIKEVISLADDKMMNEAVKAYWKMTYGLCLVFAPELKCPEFGTEIDAA